MMGSSDSNNIRSKSSNASFLEKSRAALSKIHQFCIVLHTADLISYHMISLTVAHGLNTYKSEYKKK
jgi:hypothetical protein